MYTNNAKIYSNKDSHDSSLQIYYFRFIIALINMHKKDHAYNPRYKI